MKRDKLPVIFRAERSGKFKGAVTAVFPTMPGTYDPFSVTVYAHLGQHGAGSRAWFVETRAAKPDEFASPLAELQSIYSRADDPDAVDLVVAHKWTQRHDQIRRAELKRVS